VADSLPGLGAFIPVSINQLYTFFEKKSSPSSFAAVAFAAKIASIPSPFNYTKDDTWYFFPLNYGNNDSSNFALTIGIPSFGSIKQVGYRKSRVDGYGTIVTPYYTTPVNCLRIRSEIHQIDSVSFGTGTPFGFPQNSVEYKWLVNGGHYPALWVTTNMTGGTETIVSIRYRDNARILTNGVAELPKSVGVLNAYPNPLVNGITQLEIPATWKTWQVEIFNATGKVVYSATNEADINLSNCPSGIYYGRITSGAQSGYVRIEK
jgi:Secretion system C-terminal sorting domain